MKTFIRIPLFLFKRIWQKHGILLLKINSATALMIIFRKIFGANFFENAT